mmetsp:Transcript_49305/g.127171  ORF Transcript_49305/g.127171 Transcript_49305/m.127171 type:complete len:307 (+) Transcript_49305:98-1018(+)
MAAPSLEDAQESLFFPSCGTQPEAIKRSQPIWSLPKASRDTEQRRFISKKHKQDLLGKDSPGFVYEPKRQRELPKWGFGSADARPHLAPNRYPETSNDLCCKSPDALTVKYGNPKAASIGTAARDAPSNSPDFQGFTPGTISPGPQRYDPSKAPPCIRLAHAPSADQIPAKYTMRMKTKILEADSQTPAKVGPGTYPIPSACGEQPVKKSLPRWSVNKIDRFKTKVEHGDSGRLWDGEGKQKIAMSRSFSAAPSFSFGTSTRAHQKKVAPALTQLDKGPAADHVRKDHPHIAPRREIVKYSGVNCV